MFLFSGRGYWQELIEFIVWTHNKLKVAPATQPRALSIIQGRPVEVTHYLLGGIATTWAFFLARIIAVQDPLHVRPIAHAIWDPHFGQPAVEAFTRGGALGPVNIAYSGVYQWWYTIGLRTNQDLYTGALFLLFLSAISLIAGWLHLQPKWKPSVSWFKNAESRLNHHLSGLFGVSSLAWTGHLVHVAIPAYKGE
ncbi:Photosystem I chlorophyll a apoprotein A2 [Capsicum chinense]|nr:Photosystem I chlorophyll a apoprotein A2 [Capsicum chinense]